MCCHLHTAKGINMNKINRPMSSNNHLLGTANKSIDYLKLGGGQNQREHNVILEKKIKAMHQTVVSEIIPHRRCFNFDKSPNSIY